MAFPVLAPEREELWCTEKYGDLCQGDKRLASAFVTGRVEMRQLRGMLYKIEFFDYAVVHRRKVEDALNARVYLTKKKAKSRMADLEETGCLVSTNPSSESHWTLSLAEVAGDPREFKGLVVAKPAQSEPVSEEPAIYGYVRFINDRPEVATTENALGLHEYADLLKKSAQPKWKSMSYYRRMARKAWETLEKGEEDEIDFEEFRRALDLMDLAILEPRAMRLFQACDMDNSGKIGMTEFEMALMTHDGAPDAGLTPRDVFDMFDADRSGKITRTAFPRVVGAILEEKKTRYEDMDALFDKFDRDKSGEITYGEFRKAWTRLVDVDVELRKRGIKAKRLPSGLLNALFGFVAREANRRSLLVACDNEEKKERAAFDAARRKVDEVRELARRKRDERKRARAAERERLHASAARDTALRNKELNARLQREQAARSRHRTEEKVMRNKLQVEQAAAKRRSDAQLRLRTKESEIERLRDIREAGLDRLDESGHDYKELPTELFRGAIARNKLTDVVYADLGDNRLETLPEDGFLAWFASLRYLRLSNNRLREIPALETGKMGKLEILALSRNELTALPDNIGELSELRELDVSMNRLETVPPALGRLGPTLESLSLRLNAISTLSAATIGSLFSLRDLDLSSNQLFELPDDFSEAVNLTRVDLHNNKLHKLPEQFGILPKLRSLDLSANRLTTLPDSSRHLSSCEVFMLHGNEFAELSDWVGGWKQALIIDASDNRIVGIDKSIGALHRLQELRLPRNQVLQLPPELGLAKQLELVDFASNAFQTFHVELGALFKLHTVTFRQNHMSGVVPDEIGLLCSVTSLDLSHNAIEELPATIEGLHELLYLNLDHNRLETVPDSIVGCQRLEHLSVAANRLLHIPLFLGECSALKIIDLTSNIIAELPADLTRLKQVEKIFLGKNRLRALPIEIVNLLDTTKLDLEKNPFTDLPPILGCYTEQKQLRRAHKHNGELRRASWQAGYNGEAAMQWMRDHAKFYHQALAEWEYSGPLHVSGRSSLAAFEFAVQRRCGKEWEDRLTPLLRAYYFQARKTGNAPKFNKLLEKEVKQRERIAKKANAFHESRASKVIKESLLAASVRDDAYHKDLPERIKVAETIANIRRDRASMLRSIANVALVEETKKRAKKQNERHLYIEETRQDQKRLEHRALHQHIRDTYGEPSDGTHYFP